MPEKELTPANIKSAATQIVKPKSNLDPKLWDGGGDEGFKLKPNISEKLKKIAEDFWGKITHGDAELLDVIITGSSVGFRWIPTSDIDLHLIIRKIDMDENQELVDSYCRARTKLWNVEHDVTIEGHPVEIYIQDADEPHHSSNIYSLMKDEWIAGPIVLGDDDIGFEKIDVIEKTMMIGKDIERIIDTLKNKPSLNAVAAADRLRERIKKLRAEGLEEGGEIALENVVFKVIRHLGLLDQLDEVQRTAYDSLVSEE